MPFNEVKKDRSSYGHMKENAVSHNPSESHMHRISGGLNMGVLGESPMNTQAWVVGKEPHIPREGHSPKPNPHYVNVDFSARSGILQKVAGMPVKDCNSSHHIPR